MVMTIPAGELRSAPRPALLDALRAAWHAYLERRAHRRLALRRAGRLGPRLARRHGDRPATIASVSGGWDDCADGLMLPGKVSGCLTGARSPPAP